MLTGRKLLHRLADLTSEGPVNRYLVAFSGGLDSTVLLHALASARETLAVPLTAVHVNHGLQAGSDAWEAHCRAFARELTVRYDACRVVVDTGQGRGVEAAARERRYAAIATLMQPGDVVVSAHHQDDQAETLLLNLLRASGPAGIAGIGAVRPLGPGRLCRPLLDVPREAILAYAHRAGLEWVDDPSNADAGFDRNFLRREIMPRLTERWPAVSRAFRRSAELASESQQLLVELADLDLTRVAGLSGNASRLDVHALGRLSPARQRNLLRRAILCAGLPPAPAKRLFEAVATLIPAGPDAQPLLRWPGAELRRYRGRLFLLPAAAYALPDTPLALATDGSPLALGPGLGSLRLEEDARGGICPERVDGCLTVRFRTGGERLRPHGRGETHRLKKLLQAAGIVPWMRHVIPLLYAGDSLVAAGDLWVDDRFWSAPGLAVRWHDRPALS